MIRAARFLLWAGACLSGAWCCAQGRQEVAQEVDPAATKLYRRACDHVARGHLDLAFDRLQESLGYGHTHPMEVVSDSCFAPLFADPHWRAALRGLLRRHAWEDSTVMVASFEPGERIGLLLRVTDAGSGDPVARVTVGLEQADSQGRCLDSLGVWNPRLFAYLLTSDSGVIQVETVRPGPPAAGSRDTLSDHIQVHVSGDGYASLAGRIFFSDLSGPFGNPEEKSDEPSYLARPLENVTSPSFYRVEIGLSQVK